MDSRLLKEHNLSRLAPILTSIEKQAIAFTLEEPSIESTSRSRLGGYPLLPPTFNWPHTKQQVPLDFLLQIDLADLKQLDPTGALPATGLLTFFYDLDNQPWGYDPADQDGFHVELISDESLEPHDVPASEYPLDEQVLRFSLASSLPHHGSRSFDEFERLAKLTADEGDRYLDFLSAYEKQFYAVGECHHLFGYSSNVQGDMQLEAQLVTNGLYCGDSSGYEDRRAKNLRAGADDWMLLLQLDSDRDADLMWGDAGLLFFWIRTEDLVAGRFDRVWMTLQCG